MPHDQDQFDTLPPAIIDALRDLEGPAVLPDHHRDADVLSGARQHLAGVSKVHRKRHNLRLFFAGGAGGAIAAAAMIAVVVFIADPKNEPAASQDLALSPNRPQPIAAQPGDLDADGTIDILDAYALAKQVLPIKANPALQQHDMNGDGSTDLRDVDWIANQAVALNSREQG